MTTIRPGAPVTVTDEYLAAILVELRGINAKLDQVVTTTSDVTTVEGTFSAETIERAIVDVVEGRTALL